MLLANQNWGNILMNNKVNDVIAFCLYLINREAVNSHYVLFFVFLLN